jgi:tetratricopeptide (TPR) repeat protein
MARSLLLSFAILATATSVEARGQALPGADLEACVTQPSPACLLDRAAAEREAFARAAPKDEPFNRTRWLVDMATTEQAAARLTQAARYYAQIPPAEMHELFIDIDNRFLPMPVGLDADGAIAKALEAAASAPPQGSERPHEAMDRRAQAGWLLLAFGQKEKADAILRSATRDLLGQLGSSNTQSLGAASTHMDALIALGDQPLIDAMTSALNALDLPASDEGTWLKEERQRALRALRLARIRTLKDSDPSKIEPQAGDDDYVMGQIAYAWAYAGQVDRTAKLLKSAPMPDQELASVVSQLLMHDKPDTALLLINRTDIPIGDSGVLTEVGEDLIRRGRVAEGEALLDRVTSPYQRAESMITRARRRAENGQPDEARALLEKAVAIVNRQEEFNERVILGLDAAAVYALLGDKQAARSLVDPRLANLKKASKTMDPLTHFAIAGKAAAVLLELGDGAAALGPIDAATERGDESSRVMGGVIAARTLADWGRRDLARQFAQQALAAGVVKRGVSHEDWSGLFRLFAVLFLSTEKPANIPASK